MKRGRVYKNVFNTLTANVQHLMFKPWICTCVWHTVILEHTCILPVHCLQVFVCGQKDCFLASSCRGLTPGCLLHLEEGWQFKTPGLLGVTGQGPERCPTWVLHFPAVRLQHLWANEKILLLTASYGSFYIKTRSAECETTCFCFIYCLY